MPGRIESVESKHLSVRFVVGWGVEVSHGLDPLLASHLIAPAGTRTLPLLSGQPIDFLHRISGSDSFPASEQWLSGAFLPTTLSP